MVKRKLTFPSPYNKKRLGDFWGDFKNSFFGTISDPIGTLVSLAKGQQPSWNRSSAWKNMSIFDHRKGFIGNLLSSFGIGYLKDALTGGIDAIGRKSNFNYDPGFMHYKLLYRHPNIKRDLLRNGRSMPHPSVYYDRRGGPLTDMLYNFLQNKTVRDIGKKALITGAGVIVPKAIDYVGKKIYGSKKRRLPVLELEGM
ncbi:MAG: hypothetical protein ACRDDH_00065 [Cetobacterium sp.]|uniref:hypothetical protein n=1 Tax=Cetobacterium sp. TaxID=2071632 RepID=UPI003EE80BA6